MKFRTLKNIRDLNGKRVLLRVDFNVPLKGKKIADDRKIVEALPTIKYLLQKGAKVILMSHLGRPKGRDNALRLDPVAKLLQKLLKKKIKKLDDCIGEKVEAAIDKMQPGEIVLLENVRFHAGEELCEKHFVKALTRLGDIFVNDAFGASHRKHASIVGIAKNLPAYAGLLLEKEIQALTPLLHKPAHPLTLIMGGAKIADKIGIIKNFFHQADSILVGGGLANTFLKAAGYDIGQSFHEPDKLELAREIMLLAEKYHEKFYLPQDAVVADEIKEKARALDIPLEDVEADMKILDIGSFTRLKYLRVIEKSKTIIWNGPVGLFEFKPFSNGTRTIALGIAQRKGKAKTYLGGGDTLAALEAFKIPSSKFTHVSTGGGAMLEFLEGKKLPGITALQSTHKVLTEG